MRFPNQVEITLVAVAVVETVKQAANATLEGSHHALRSACDASRRHPVLTTALIGPIAAWGVHTYGPSHTMTEPEPSVVHLDERPSGEDPVILG